MRIEPSWQRRLGGLCFLLIAFQVPASANDAFLFEHDRPDPAESRLYERVALPLPNGNEVRIVPTYDSKARLRGAFVSEIVRRGNPSILADKALKGLNSRAIFHALAPEGTPEPGFLTEEFASPGVLERQGWARGLATASPGRDDDGDLADRPGTVKNPAACVNDAQTFDDLAEEVELLGYQSTYLGERISPIDHPQYWSSLPLYNLWELYGGVSYVKAFYSSVVFCYNAIDLSPWDEDNFEESVEYSYRIGGGGFVGTGKFLVNAGDKVVFHWNRALNGTGVHDFEVGPNEAPAFRLHIENGTTYDLFHIAATWTRELPI